MSYIQRLESDEKTKVEEEEVRKHLAPWRQVLLEIVDRVASQQQEIEENNQDNAKKAIHRRMKNS